MASTTIELELGGQVTANLGVTGRTHLVGLTVHGRVDEGTGPSWASAAVILNGHELSRLAIELVKRLGTEDLYAFELSILQELQERAARAGGAPPST